MIGFDVASLTSSLVSNIKLTPAERVVVIERMVEAAVFEINNPDNYESNLDDLIDVLELEFHVINPAAVILEYKEHIEREMQKHCWDPRLKIKTTKKQVGKSLLKIFIDMDLELTFLLMNPVETEKEVLGEVVESAPSLDQLNELIDKVGKRPARSTKVLPSLQSRFVDDPEGRGFTSSQRTTKV